MSRIDPSKLGGWYGAYAAGLVLYARQWAGAGAEDVVQEAFIALLGQGREPENVRAWLFKAVRNAALSSARSSKRRDRRERVVTESRPEWFVPRPEDLIDAATAQEALKQLSDELREVVVLRIWGQMSFAEIADVAGTPLSSVYDRYKTGLAVLKQKLESSCRNRTLIR